MIIHPCHRITLHNEWVKAIKGALRGFVQRSTFGCIWIYKVILNGRAQTWLGDEEDVSDVLIRTREPYQESIMFRQTSLSPMSWKGFIDHLKETEDGRILLTVNLEFEHFNKQEHIIVSVEEIKVLFENSYPEGYPYWVEPKALMI